MGGVQRQHRSHSLSHFLFSISHLSIVISAIFAAQREKVLASSFPVWYKCIHTTKSHEREDLRRRISKRGPATGCKPA
jgi:hypothetical protein